MKPQASLSKLSPSLCLVLLLAPAFAVLPPCAAGAEEPERAMFGNTPSRNMVSDETGLPSHWDVATGENVKWTEPLGTQSYAGPLVAGGKVFVGTNNEGLRNPDLTGDRGNLMVFRAEDGEFLWQSAHPKLESGKVNDWPLQGVCSTPYVEGDRLWYVSNRAELIAASIEGFRDGANRGPYTDEVHTSEIDEDVIWKLDMMAELDVFPHNLAAGSPLVVGDLVFTVTGNGVDEGHVNLPSPLAPSFIAVDKNTGELAWESNLPGTAILHGSWSNPSYGVVGGRPQVLFPGGDGWLYSFAPETGELLWKFDCNPKDSVWILGGAGTRNNLISMAVVHDERVYIGVGQDPEHGEGVGNFWVIDPTAAEEPGEDITGKAVVWHRGGDDLRRTISTAAIADGIVYISDLSGFLYALDAATGEHFWTHDTFAAVWGSPFVADGKVYLGDEDGDVSILRAGKTKEVIAEINMGSAVYTTPVAKDGVLYVVSRNRLFALEEGAGPKPETEAEAADGAADGGEPAEAAPGEVEGR